MTTTTVTQKELEFKKYTHKEAKAEKSFPTYDPCNHYFVDMSHLDPKSEDWKNTLVIKLPNGVFATLCVMQTAKYSMGIDVALTGSNLERVTAIPMGDREDLPRIDGLPNNNRNTYAVVADVRKPLERV